MDHSPALTAYTEFCIYSRHCCIASPVLLGQTVTSSVPTLVAIAMGNNTDAGSTFEQGVEEPALRDEVTVAAIKAVVARQLVEEMIKKNLSKARMAKLMKTSRTQIARLVDPENGNVTIESLQRAARTVGRELRMDLV